MRIFYCFRRFMSKKNDLVKQLKEKLLEDRSKAMENPPIEISETSVDRMNGPIGIEITKKDVKMLAANKMKKRIIKS